MRVVIQRVSGASVTIGGVVHSSIGKGLLILIGIEISDAEADVIKLVGKIPKLRIFNDEMGLMNLSIAEVNGDYLVISQFTLHAETKKGNRPSYIKSARPEQAVPLYEKFINLLEKESGKKIATGIFGADMKVELINDGPVTIIIDTQNDQ
ncbi:MAG: D-aminoacyl-tRNA deacylase [Bacteroidota bacterium]|nr:D-aminoacyl-tRNA deacylase [Bacteroidota bacterium]